MDETILITSEQYKVKRFFNAMVLIGLVLTLILTFYFFSYYVGCYNKRWGDHEHWWSCYSYAFQDDYYADLRNGGLQEWKMDCGPAVYGNAVFYAVSEFFRNYLQTLVSLAPLALFALIGGLTYLRLRSYELTVTDKRIFGKAAWGKRVDLPVDSISATATTNLLKGVSVSTASGSIRFLLIKNADAVYDVINKLLIERQQENARSVPVAAAPVKDAAEEIKKFKELLDMGIITQDEFDAKKKQLLGL